MRLGGLKGRTLTIFLSLGPSQTRMVLETFVGLVVYCQYILGQAGQRQHSLKCSTNQE